MSIQPRAGTLTFGDFLELVREDQKADLLEGVIFMASPESIAHNDLVSWLTEILGPFVRQRGLGRLTVNKVAFRLARHVAPEPDIGFVASHREAIIKPGYVDGPPDLAVEIVSPESVECDYVRKRRYYEQAGVREYWIIDPDERKALFLRLDPTHGVFVEVELSGFLFTSQALPGLRLDVRWLFERPLRPTAPIVQALAKVRWYRIEAQRLYFIDNSRGFGHREQVELPNA